MPHVPYRPDYHIYKHGAGDAELIASELSAEEVSAEDRREHVQGCMKEVFAEYLGRRLPKAFEKLFYSDETRRAKG